MKQLIYIAALAVTLGAQTEQKYTTDGGHLAPDPNALAPYAQLFRTDASEDRLFSRAEMAISKAEASMRRLNHTQETCAIVMTVFACLQVFVGAAVVIYSYLKYRN